tara:strand:+ start:636 stop:1436 length:801 start_codon:yes stop_codon:yes gene_type:complete
MKYTYFSSTKSGKYLIRSQFWYNRKSCAFLSQSKPLWCVLSSPIGNLDKLEWYWCDKDTKLSKHSHFLDTRDKLTSSHYDEMWFPIPDHRGHETIPRDQWITHENFYQCVDDIMSRDIITNPFPLLGYTGSLGAGRQQDRMQNSTPNINPRPDIIERLRQRKNIVVYKENIEHLAYNVFAGTGRPESVEETTIILNNIIKFQKFMPKFLDSLDIPYEMFSLDTGDYAKTFNLDKILPRDSSDTLFTRNVWNQDIDRQVKDYMDKYT